MSAVSENSFVGGQNIESANILQRIAAGEKSAVEDCVNLYGGAVWKLANKIAADAKDAETITLDVFEDIWKYAADSEAEDFKDANFIALILRRRLSIYREQNLLCDLRKH